MRRILRSIPHRSIPVRRIPHKILPLKSAPMIVPAIVALSMLLHTPQGNIFLETNPVTPQETYAMVDYLVEKSEPEPMQPWWAEHPEAGTPVPLQSGEVTLPWWAYPC